VLNDRGQIVIPEEVRKDLHLKAGEALVLLEAGGEILLKKESQVVKQLSSQEGEKIFWRALAVRAMEGAWDDQDEAWEQYAPKNEGY